MASGVLKRTALFCRINGGVYDSGWRACVTKIGNMVEPTPYSMRVDASTDTHDQEFYDQIGHIDDIGWTQYKDRNLLSGTVSAIKGSSDGWVHGGITIMIDNPNK
jgi:hypothetical protein